jgi:hypothetical protein
MLAAEGTERTTIAGRWTAEIKTHLSREQVSKPRPKGESDEGSSVTVTGENVVKVVETLPDPERAK